MQNTTRRGIIGISILSLLVFGAGLAYFAYLGFYTRFWQDDWCYNADFQRLGLWGTLKGYTYITTYASHRYSLTLFSGLLYFLGVTGVRILPGLTILLWLGGQFFLFKNIIRLTRRQIPLLVTFLASAVVIFFVVYLAPNRFQSFYWRSGLLPYTAPAIAITWLAVLLSGPALHARKFKWVFALVPVLTYLGTGFSEAGGATMTAGLIILLAVSWYGKRKKFLWAENLFPVVLVALVFAIAGMVTMILSPSNETRRLGSYSEKNSNLLLAIPLSIKYGVLFVYESIKGYPLPHAIFLCLFGLMGYLWQSTSGAPQCISAKAWLRNSALIFAGALVLIFAMAAPSAYIEVSPAADRTWVISRHILLLAFALVAWISGEFLSGRLTSKVWQWAALAALLIPLVYTTRAVKNTYDFNQPRFEKIAATWDERDLKIRTERSQGKEVIEVRAIDSAFVGGVGEWYPKPNWINNCAADYYGVQEIRATLPW